MAIESLKYLEKILANGTLEQAVTHHTYGEALDDALKQVQEAQPKLDDFVVARSSSNMVSEGWTETEQQQAVGLLRRVEHCGHKVASANTQHELSQIHHDIKSAVADLGELQRTMIRGWEKSIQIAFEADAGLAKLLENMPQTQNIGQRLRQHCKAGLALKHNFPPDEAQQASLEQARLGLQQVRDELAQSGAGTQLIEFLLLAADKKATLAHLSPDVLKWLKDRDLLQYFIVSVT